MLVRESARLRHYAHFKMGVRFEGLKPAVYKHQRAQPQILARSPTYANSTQLPR